MAFQRKIWFQNDIQISVKEKGTGAFLASSHHTETAVRIGMRLNVVAVVTRPTDFRLYNTQRRHIP